MSWVNFKLHVTMVMCSLPLSVPALRLTPTNITLLWQKATLHSELNEPRKALDTLQNLLNVRNVQQLCVP